MTADRSTPTGKTVKFSLEGRQYEVDLHSDNLRSFREAFAGYTEHARPVRSRAKRKVEVETAKPDSKAVRAWASEQGLTLSSRGRIPADLLEQYRAAVS